MNSQSTASDPQRRVGLAHAARPCEFQGTYRLQLGQDLTFAQATALADYFTALGIGAVYLSPFFQARAGSTHGYDVVDHTKVDSKLGEEKDFESLAQTMRQRGLGLLLDLVPNHMGVDDPGNLWWQDVLENGPASPYARYFDIDWNPPKSALHNKVLLPVLGDQFGKVLESQQLSLDYRDQRFVVCYYERHFPTDPRTWTGLLKQAVEAIEAGLPPDNPDRMELESIISSLEHLPPRDTTDQDAVLERYREKEVARRRLATLMENCEPIRRGVEQVLADFNGARGQPASFDKLDALLADQPYRLCYWRVATDEINYRRFFDVDSLAAIRVEDPQVFAAVHAKVLQFISQGLVSGLRVDHADGLLDPRRYLTDLAQSAREALAQFTGDVVTEIAPPYMLVEKILAPDESLPGEWPIQGTTGYDFLNQLNGLFVDRLGTYTLRDIYHRFIGDSQNFSQTLYESKRTILSTSLSSELNVLAHQLDQISEQHRWSRDFTRLSLFRALREVVACFPVYRTYIRPEGDVISDEDRRRINAAVRTAKRRNPAMSATFFDFIASVLLLEDPEGISEADRQARRAFVLKFQQVTGPVTAKGLEDTAFYRYYPLASLNEVGGEPTIPGTTVEQLHRWLEERAARWPYSLSTTGTHDTKRGEDVRARLNVLSEVPDAWQTAIARWSEANAAARGELDGAAVPDRNEEYLIYQTLVGTWPMTQLSAEGHQAYVDRITAYLDKALREAKLHTSWLNPYEEYDAAVTQFIRMILADRQSDFARDLGGFARGIAVAGAVNGLAQALVKICAPGIPDFYQGTEFWDFHLVDPDNRRPVDFAARRDALATIIEGADRDLAGLANGLLEDLSDPRLKLFVIWRALEQRHKQPEVFDGAYEPLQADGPRKGSVFCFSRAAEARRVVCLVPRLAHDAWHADGPRIASNTARWQDTIIPFGDDYPSHWQNLFTGQSFEAALDGAGRRVLDVAETFKHFPIALLASIS